MNRNLHPQKTASHVIFSLGGGLKTQSVPIKLTSINTVLVHVLVYQLYVLTFHENVETRLELVSLQDLKKMHYHNLAVGKFQRDMKGKEKCGICWWKVTISKTVRLALTQLHTSQMDKK